MPATAELPAELVAENVQPVELNFGLAAELQAAFSELPNMPEETAATEYETARLSAARSLGGTAAGSLGFWGVTSLFGNAGPAVHLIEPREMC